MGEGRACRRRGVRLVEMGDVAHRDAAAAERSAAVAGVLRARRVAAPRRVRAHVQGARELERGGERTVRVIVFIFLDFFGSVSVPFLSPPPRLTAPSSPRPSRPLSRFRAGSASTTRSARSSRSTPRPRPRSRRNRTTSSKSSDRSGSSRTGSDPSWRSARRYSLRRGRSTSGRTRSGRSTASASSGSTRSTCSVAGILASTRGIRRCSRS